MQLRHQQEMHRLLNKVGYRPLGESDLRAMKTDFLESYSLNKSEDTPKTSDKIGNGFKKRVDDTAFCNHGHVVAPAYNKGPSMVVPKSEVKHIGRK